MLNLLDLFLDFMFAHPLFLFADFLRRGDCLIQSLDPKLLSLHLVKLLYALVVLFLVVQSNPLKLLHLLLRIIIIRLNGTVFLSLPLYIAGLQSVIDFLPARGVFLADEHQSLACPVGPGRPADPVHVGVAVDGHAVLDDIGDHKIEASRGHVG